MRILEVLIFYQILIVGNKLKEAVSIEPMNLDANYNLANTLFREGKITDAYRSYIKTLELDDQFEKAWINIYYCIRANYKNSKFNYKELDNIAKFRYSKLMKEALFFKLNVCTLIYVDKIKDLKQKTETYQIENIYNEEKIKNKN